MAMMGIIDEPDDRLQRIGNIKMGRKGKARPKSSGEGTYRIPEKFDHFEITTMERDENDDWLPDEGLITLLGKNPKTIPVMVPYDDIMDIFPHELAWWKSSKRMCHGNGMVGLRYDEKTNTDVEMKCRCEMFTGAGGVKRVCKKNGILNVIITASGRIGGVFQLRTTSGATISNIKASINLIKSFTGGPVAGIPLMLTIQKQWAYPIVKGVKQKVEIYAAGLEFRADMSLSMSPSEQLLERAGVQVQARLSVGRDVKQIEQFSAGRISTDTAEDLFDREHEFGVGVGDDSAAGGIEGKTQGKTAELKERLDKAKVSDAETIEDEAPQKTEPTTDEIKQNLRTEIETLLENDLLPDDIVKKTTEWLKGGRHVTSLESTRDKLIKKIDECEQRQSGEGEKAAEDLKKNLRIEITDLAGSEFLPKAVSDKWTTWLKDQERSADSLQAGRDALVKAIQGHQHDDGPPPEGNDKEKDEPGKADSTPSLVECGAKVIDLLGGAREEGLVTEEEHGEVFDQADSLETVKEITALYEKWESEIDDRRLIREEEKKQSTSK